MPWQANYIGQGLPHWLACQDLSRFEFMSSLSGVRHSTKEIASRLKCPDIGRLLYKIPIKKIYRLSLYFFQGGDKFIFMCIQYSLLEYPFTYIQQHSHPSILSPCQLPSADANRDPCSTCLGLFPEAKFLDVIRKKVLRAFLLAIQSHLY